jgi:hypothetical protein
VARRALALGLGVYNDARGGKGYGVFDGKKVRKGAETMALFLAQYGTNWALQPRGFLHTRYPSTGEQSKENAHPFVVGPVVGAHNGCVANHAELNRKYDRAFAVDSTHIFAHLAEGRSLDDVEAYGAIEWFDSRDRRWRVCFFNGGDLAGMDFRDKGTRMGVAWSSKKDHLQEAVEAAGLWTPGFHQPLDGRVVYDVTDGAWDKCRAYGRLDVGTYASRKTWQGGYAGAYAGAYAGTNHALYEGDFDTPVPAALKSPAPPTAPADAGDADRKAKGGPADVLSSVTWTEVTAGGRREVTRTTYRSGSSVTTFKALPDAPAGTSPAVSLHDVTTRAIPEAVRAELSGRPLAEVLADDRPTPPRLTGFVPAEPRSLDEAVEAFQRGVGLDGEVDFPVDPDPAETPPDAGGAAADRRMAEDLLLAHLDARSPYHPLADSGYVDASLNPVLWVDVDDHRVLWDPEADGAPLQTDPQEVMISFWNNATQDEAEALTELTDLRAGSPGRAARTVMAAAGLEIAD